MGTCGIYWAPSPMFGEMLLDKHARNLDGFLGMGTVSDLYRVVLGAYIGPHTLAIALLSILVPWIYDILPPNLVFYDHFLYSVGQPSQAREDVYEVFENVRGLP